MTPVQLPDELTLLTWRHPRPAALVEWLVELGFDVTRDGAGPTVRLAPIALQIRKAAGAREERLVVTRGRGTAGSAGRERVRHRNGIRRLLAVGVGTVDAERTMTQASGRSFVPAADDEALGARAWLDATTGRPPVVVLEPRTEGRLAAALARHGEGPLALYLDAAGGADSRFAGALERSRRWPGGQSARLIRPAQPWGPFLLAVEEPGPWPPATTPPGE